MHLISTESFQRRRLNQAEFSDVRLDGCSFDNCSIHGGTLERLELNQCRTWSCSLSDLIVEDCIIDGLSTTVHGARGRRTPLFLWGVRSSHVVLKGRIGALVWNQPRDWRGPESQELVEFYRRYYESVDWALDVSNAVFTAVPSLRYGPPGRLIRRDPETQPLVTRERVLAADWDPLMYTIGVWRVVIQHMLDHSWPNEIVLLPARAGKSYKAELAGIEILRASGIAT